MQSENTIQENKEDSEQISEEEEVQQTIVQNMSIENNLNLLDSETTALVQSKEQRAQYLENQFNNPEDKKDQNLAFSQVLKNRQNVRKELKLELFSPLRERSQISSLTSLDHSQNYESNQISPNSCQVISTNGLCTIKPILLQPKNTSPAQDPGSCGIGSFGSGTVFLRLAPEDTEAYDQDKKQSIFHINGNIQKYYLFKESLGEGCVGLVKRAIQITDQKQYAVKIIKSRDEEMIRNIKNEFIHVKNLSHKNIVKFYEIYIDDLNGAIYLFMELIKGKEMFEVIHKLGHYSELIAQQIFQQIIDAVYYLHDHLVCHRDLKPNNILCSDDGNTVVITDFNISQFYDNEQKYDESENKGKLDHIKMWTSTGTPSFSAPEMIANGSYDQSIDMWSAGVILYTMLCGHEPFQSEYEKDLLQKIMKGEYEFPSDPFDDFSFQAKDFIRRCLVLESQKRMTAQEALKHPWFEEKINDMNLKEIEEMQASSPMIKNQGQGIKLKIRNNIKRLTQKGVQNSNIQNIEDENQENDNYQTNEQITPNIISYNNNNFNLNVDETQKVADNIIILASSPNSVIKPEDQLR